MNLAYFISAHGFGHASRSSAIMAVLAHKIEDIHFEIFTEVPKWFFDDSLPGVSFAVKPLKTDIGLIQKTPMEHDLSETLEGLLHFYPFNKEVIEGTARQLINLECEGVICDISPIGISIAEYAHLPSVLIENFTWAWIYEPYIQTHPEFSWIIQDLRVIFNNANFHIQAEPICNPSYSASLIVSPISRKPRTDPSKVRGALRITPGKKMVLITMGGIPETFSTLMRLNRYQEFLFVIPGGGKGYSWDDQLRLIPHHSIFYHPDLIEAADIVIGKAGYSTIAEVYQSGKPFGFISRKNFRESPILQEYVTIMMDGVEIPEDSFRANQFLDSLMILDQNKLIPKLAMNGADQAADFLIKIFNI